jgi:hypothetical protein
MRYAEFDARKFFAPFNGQFAVGTAFKSPLTKVNAVSAQA